MYMQSWSRVMNFGNWAVFKWLSKVITWLRLLRLVIGLKGSRQFFNQWEAKPKLIAPCMRDFSRASSELQVIARNCDWFMALFVPIVIGRSNCLGFGFSTVIWKPLCMIAHPIELLALLGWPSMSIYGFMHEWKECRRRMWRGRWTSE